MFGLVTKTLLKETTNDYDRKFNKLMSACDATIQSVKEKCLGSDKMYARSNEIKFKAMEQRISQLEQMLAEQLSEFKDQNKDKEIRAAEDAHAKMDEQSEQ